jgi:molybdopterin synthase sulfur carrier subunit
MIKVMLFAGIAEKAKQNQLQIEEDGLSIRDLRSWLSEQYPSISEDITQAMVAVNEEFVDESTLLQAHDVVAIIPPVSGG